MADVSKEARDEAMQEIDLLTGGDGEYRYCMGGHDPDRHCPDADTMRNRIVSRFKDQARITREAAAMVADAEWEAREAENQSGSLLGFGGACAATRIAQAIRSMPDVKEGLCLRGKMSSELEAAIERLRDYKMSPQEKFEQRVSFVYGQQDHDNPNPKTKDEIRQMLIDHEGSPDAVCKTCQGCGWVCENHRDTAWAGYVGGEECCGGAGAPCGSCNLERASAGYVYAATTRLRETLIMCRDRFQSFADEHKAKAADIWNPPAYRERAQERAQGNIEIVKKIDEVLNEKI